MIDYFLILFLVVIFVEAVVEIITASKLFEKFRIKVENIVFIGGLFTCPYCLSVWISASVCWVIPDLLFVGDIICYVLHILVVHRMSNIFHSAINGKLKNKPKEKIVYHMNRENDDGMQLREEQEQYEQTSED